MAPNCTNPRDAYRAARVQVAIIAKHQTDAPERILRGHPSNQTCVTAILNSSHCGSRVSCLPSRVRQLKLIRFRDRVVEPSSRSRAGRASSPIARRDVIARLGRLEVRPNAGHTIGSRYLILLIFWRKGCPPNSRLTSPHDVSTHRNLCRKNQPPPVSARLPA